MTTFPVVRFSKELLIMAKRFGDIRTQHSIGRKDNWGLIRSDTEEDRIEDSRRQTIGTLGEWAVACYFGVKYEFSVDSFKAPDVYVNGPDGYIWGLQVKASEYGKNFIIRPDAKDYEPYIYCYVEMPAGDPDNFEDLPEDTVTRVHIKGWMYPREARERAHANPKLIRDPGGRRSPAIFIPVPQIRPIQELRQEMGV